MIKTSIWIGNSMWLFSTEKVLKIEDVFKSKFIVGCVGRRGNWGRTYMWTYFIFHCGGRMGNNEVDVCCQDQDAWFFFFFVFAWFGSEGVWEWFYVGKFSGKV